VGRGEVGDQGRGGKERILRAEKRKQKRIPLHYWGKERWISWERNSSLKETVVHLPSSKYSSLTHLFQFLS
jgi:hypothetical protein